MGEQPCRHHAGTAAVLSFIFNGLGQLYNGQIVKGLIIMSATSLCLVVILIGAVMIFHWVLARLHFIHELVIGTIVFVVGVIAACIIGTYSIYDAYHTAAKS